MIIATTTFYTSQDDVRYKLACQFMEKATKEHDVVVVDGSPNPAIRNSFIGFGAIVFEQQMKGMGASRREALSHAVRECGSSGTVIGWIEPEKVPLISSLNELEEMFGWTTCEMAVPRRRSLASYPEYQQFCELRGNWAVGNMTRMPELDLWFGPRIMTQEIALKYFIGYEGDYGDRWDSIFVPVVRAIADNRGVMSYVVDYTHPAEQTAVETGDEEMNRKRDIQLASIIEGMHAECLKLGLCDK